MAKKKDLAIVRAFKIFLEGTSLYFKNADKFLKYMTFPVLGQILGIVLIFTVVHLFAKHINAIVSINPALNNVSVMFLALIILITPGFMVFFAAFWKYLVAMGALNSMANNLISGAKLEDLKIHNDTVTRRSGTFVTLILIMSIISIIGLFPLFWIPLLIVMIYLCLVFQVFALEENLNSWEIIQKSARMIKGNFGLTIILLVLLWFFTYNVFPELFNFAFEKAHIYKFLVIPIEAFSKNLPLTDLQTTIETVMSAINAKASFTLDIAAFSKSIAVNTLATVIIGYTLPLRSICCTLLYKELEIKRLKDKKIKEL